MRKKGYPPEAGGMQRSSTPLRAPQLTDVAERLFDAYLDTFKRAPESEFLLKRYFFEIYFEKEYLQDNIFFIPRDKKDIVLQILFFKIYLEKIPLEEEL